MVFTFDCNLVTPDLSPWWRTCESDCMAAQKMTTTTTTTAAKKGSLCFCENGSFRLMVWCSSSPEFATMCRLACCWLEVHTKLEGGYRIWELRNFLHGWTVKCNYGVGHVFRFARNLCLNIMRKAVSCVFNLFSVSSLCAASVQGNAFYLLRVDKSVGEQTFGYVPFL